MALDLLKYEGVIRKSIELAKELAALTGNTLDDQVVSQIKTFFEAFFGPGVMRMSAAGFETAPPQAMQAAGAMPVWLLPLLLQVAKLVLDQLKA